MGDLVLSFPLLAWLAEVFPLHPLWVVGERMFFEPLLPLSPAVTYFDYGEKPVFRDLSFHAVINLSHRREAAVLAGGVRSDSIFGPYLDAKGRLLINGDWHLYRASLTDNNRYNVFHWSDLNALDIIPDRIMARTRWPRARPLPLCDSPERKEGGPCRRHPRFRRGGARIGLFLGASEAEKHPGAGFWSILAKWLLRAGHKPVLLGGSAEKLLGSAVANTLQAHALNLCGHFSISALARFIGELDLLIVPDTGPMHIAAWMGTPLVNLSLGPVNPWETGPFAPGHHVVRAALDCVGCWRCTQESAVCKEEMTAEKIAVFIDALLSGGNSDLPSLGRQCGGLEVLRTNRGCYGLYALEEVFRAPPVKKERYGRTFGREIPDDNAVSAGTETVAVRRSLALFWKSWFGTLFGRFTAREDFTAWESLRVEHPHISEQLRNGAVLMMAALVKHMRGNRSNAPDFSDVWKRSPPFLHPLSGYMDMYVQNALGSRESFLYALSLLERIAALPR